MALTLTELMVVPGTGNRRMAIWKVTGDGDTTNIAIAKLKMAKVEVAWTVNINAADHKNVNVGTNDYVDAYVTSIDIGDPAIEDDGIQSGKEHLLIVIGY
jgi:hypothetical protein